MTAMQNNPETPHGSTGGYSMPRLVGCIRDLCAALESVLATRDGLAETTDYQLRRGLENGYFQEIRDELEAYLQARKVLRHARKFTTPNKAVLTRSEERTES